MNNVETVKCNGSDQLQQVFCYITSKCNAKCIMCYMGEQYDKCGHVPINVIAERLLRYRNRGAHKVTFLGGEPTIHPQIKEIICITKEIGFEYVRVTTNGMFRPDLLKTPEFSLVNTIAFSVDGYTQELNNALRVNTDLSTILNNMKLARDLGFDVRVNSTVTSLNIDKVEDLIGLVIKNGTRQVNLNIVFLEGSAENKDDLGITQEQWFNTYHQLLELQKKVNIEIKTPIGYFKDGESIDTDKLRKLKNKIKGRVYCMPDGSEHNCLLFIDKNKCEDLSGYNCSMEKLPHCQQLVTVNGGVPLCLDYKKRLGVKLIKLHASKEMQGQLA